MQRLMGILLVLGTCASFGFAKGQELTRHVRELESLQKIFINIQAELRYSRATLAEIFLRVSQKTEETYQKWLQALADDLQRREKGNFQELWEQAVRKHFQNSLLTKEEQRELVQVGVHLSSSDTLELYLEQLELALARTRIEAESKKKLYRSMGILTGIFLVIVLL
ncbi:MAG: stage III sporulation protein AB [Faecalimonas sp.]|nr:stage III sporulation protein AB [Faecalimonas sp.]